MNSRRLGGLEVSELALGTVSLGIDYGLPAPGQSARPADGDAVVRHAVARGITLFDTAPAYGVAEALLGAALDGGGIVATKITVPQGDVSSAIIASVEQSRRRLRRDRLDLVQIHNATEAIIAEGSIARALHRLRDAGAIAHVGASVYTEAEALAAIASGAFSTVQVAYNLLDRTMETRVFPAAQKAGVGILVRSAYLKGALTDKAAYLPPELAELRRAVDELCNRLGVAHAALPALAVRFCLAHPAVGSVLIGARTQAELDVAIDAIGPLDDAALQAIRRVEVADRRLLNPATWPAM